MMQRLVLQILVCMLLWVCPLGAVMNCDVIFQCTEPSQEAVLRAKAQDVSFPLTATHQELIAAMKEKLMQLGGVGLAAPQVGQSVRIFVIRIGETQASLRRNAYPVDIKAYINPSYEVIGAESMDADWEGCFSVPNHMGKVKRSLAIILRAQDEEGRAVERRVEGFEARVLQHEIDHLNGILSKDHLREGDEQGPMQEMMQKRLAELPVEKQTVLREFLAGMRR